MRLTRDDAYYIAERAQKELDVEAYEKYIGRITNTAENGKYKIFIGLDDRWNENIERDIAALDYDIEKFSGGVRISWYTPKDVDIDVPAQNFEDKVDIVEKP